MFVGNQGILGLICLITFFRQVGVVTGALEVESLMIEDPVIEAGKMEFPK